MTPRRIDLRALAGDALHRLPYLHRILLENLARCAGDHPAIPAWLEHAASDAEIPFTPGRVLMHDTTCGPALVDIAGCRDALAEAGGDPRRLNPILRVDVSTDHSVAVDVQGRPDALPLNMVSEYRRNAERYRLMKWAAAALDNVHIHPPGSGIMHTINLERLATVVTTQVINGETWAMPDTLIGTDSHTPMVNGLGVLAWGVGGLEAESVMFGMPVMLRVPNVVGVRLTGALPDGVLATDLALAVTERLRRMPLAGRFVEFFGPGLASLTVGQRAVVANMAPEYGATTGYFPIDAAVPTYLAATGRTANHIALVETYARQQGLWHDPDSTPVYGETLHIALDAITTSLAGPRRPQDRIAPRDAAATIPPATGSTLPHGAVAIAAITSCTNTSDPALLIAAGLLARKARAHGLAPPPWVKTSLAPGSPAAETLLRRAGLLDDLQALGFHIVGYGCTTCIGNAGPLLPTASAALEDGASMVAVLSGNRNFPGRVHADIDCAFLASPPLVIAYALAGDINRDILTDPIAHDIKLSALWPSAEEIAAALAAAQIPEDIATAYTTAESSPAWQQLDAPTSARFPWDSASTYLRPPPFARAEATIRLGHYRAHPLLVLGDDITTDHISPAGAVPPASEAARYLLARGENPGDLNVFAARRGNWEAMLRGLFTNRTIRNLLAENIPPGSTLFAPDGSILPLYQATERYRDAGLSTVILAGERYGMGSSRDWAAKGAALLGARAVLATSFERIHRSNLVNMGVLPIALPPECHPFRLQLRPGDTLDIDAEPTRLAPRATIPITLHRATGATEDFTARAEIETAQEMEVLATGGILPTILRRASA